MNNPHYPSDELDIRRKTCIGTKDCSHTQWRMIKAFAQHLNLNNTVQLPVSQVRNYFILPVFVHLTVNLVRLDAPLRIERGNLTCMVNRTCDRDQLVLEACSLPEFLQVLDAGINDVAVTRAHTHYP